MAKFTASVELFETEENGDALDAAMGKRGFERTIIGSSGATYYLPTATYRFSHPGKSAEEVLVLAKDALDAIDRKGGVLITHATDTMFSGLKTV